MLENQAPNPEHNHAVDPNWVDDFARSPFVKLTRVWKVAEKVSVSLSILLVLGTLGYLSVHALV